MIDIKHFCEKRPFLYHLTDRENAVQILLGRKLFSTKHIAERAFASATEAKKYLSTKRDKHTMLEFRGRTYQIRDQRPILMKVLGRSLEGSISAGEFLEILNARVFWWPTINRLNRHYTRYQGESPVILRVRTEDMLNLNGYAEFCSLNSGATRCHPKYGGNAPTRGERTFLPAPEYDNSIASVAEVTFPSSCRLPQTLWTAYSPNGRWVAID